MRKKVKLFNFHYYHINLNGLLKSRLRKQLSPDLYLKILEGLDENKTRNLWYFYRDVFLFKHTMEVEDEGQSVQT